MKILKLKQFFFLFVILPVLTLTVFNAEQSYGQEINTDECIRLQNCFLEYEKKINQCFGGELIDRFIPRLTHKFGITTLEVEWAEMDALHIQFVSEPDQHIFIVIYGGKINKLNEFKERSNRLVYYLTENRHIPKEKITVVNGGFRENFEFEFWLSPSGKIFPPLSPTVDVEKVKFKGKMKPLPYELGN